MSGARSANGRISPQMNTRMNTDQENGALVGKKKKKSSIRQELLWKTSMDKRVFVFFFLCLCFSPSVVHPCGATILFPVVTAFCWLGVPRSSPQPLPPPSPLRVPLLMRVGAAGFKEDSPMGLVRLRRNVPRGCGVDSLASCEVSQSAGAGMPSRGGLGGSWVFSSLMMIEFPRFCLVHKCRKFLTMLARLFHRDPSDQAHADNKILLCQMRYRSLRESGRGRANAFAPTAGNGRDAIIAMEEVPEIRSNELVSD